MAAPNLRKFQLRVAEIERDVAAGLIGNEMRRSLLAQARDQYGVTNLANREPAHPGPPMTPEQALAHKRERDRQYRERCKAARQNSATPA